MTVELCISTCRKKGFIYAGLQWQIECYCGNEPKNGFTWAWKDKCNDRCAGNSFQICGGSNSISVYSVPKIIDGLCVFDNPRRRSLGGIHVSGVRNMTIEYCQKICKGLS